MVSGRTYEIIPHGMTGWAVEVGGSVVDTFTTQIRAKEFARQRSDPGDIIRIFNDDGVLQNTLEGR